MVSDKRPAFKLYPDYHQVYPTQTHMQVNVEWQVWGDIQDIDFSGKLPNSEGYSLLFSFLIQEWQSSMFENPLLINTTLKDMIIQYFVTYYPHSERNVTKTSRKDAIKYAQKRFQGQCEVTHSSHYIINGRFVFISCAHEL